MRVCAFYSPFRPRKNERLRAEIKKTQTPTTTTNPSALGGGNACSEEEKTLKRGKKTRWRIGVLPIPKLVIVFELERVRKLRMSIFVNNYKTRRTVRRLKSTIKVLSAFRKLCFSPVCESAVKKRAQSTVGELNARKITPKKRAKGA